MRTFIVILAAAFILLTIPATAQDSTGIVCSSCKQINKTESNFCTACGAELKDEKEEIQMEKKPFTFYEPSKLLSVPTAFVMPELGIGFTIGNSFGQVEDQSFLGNVSAGIGDIAELELNTGGVVGNIIAGTTRMSIWGMKVQVYAGDATYPAAAISLRSSNDWDATSFDSQTLQTRSASQYEAGLRGLNYDMRITTVSMTLSQRIHERAVVHGVIGYSDIRHKGLGVNTVNGFTYDNSIRRFGQLQFAGGVSADINPRTKAIAEVQTIPFFNYNVSSNQLILEHMYVGAVGIRFALSKGVTLDSGVRYQSDFIGLADTQVRVALNGIFVIPL